MRINKFIASNSKFSRRKADELIKKGCVILNGELVTELGINIDENIDKIEILTQNENIKIKQNNKNYIYLALNKPKGFITTREDEFNRKTVMELVPYIENLKPVGRLDKDTEGLLLLSNDGDFINKHLHPKFECEKEYFVIIEGTLTDKEKEKLENGVYIDGKKTSKAEIKITKRYINESFLTITIHEGIKRQIRKMFALIMHNVTYLERIRIGKIKLGDLKKGKYRKLTKEEIC